MFKNRVYQPLGVALKRWLTPKSWSTPEKNVIFKIKLRKLFNIMIMVLDPLTTKLKKNNISLRSRQASRCQPALKSKTFLLVDPSFIACFCMFLCGFPSFFLYFVLLVMEKVVLASKIWFWPANHRTSCGAPLSWSKCTTYRAAKMIILLFSSNF